MAQGKPLLAAAFVCERVLREGNVFSAIRIVDIYTTKQIDLTPIPHGEKAPLVDGPQAGSGQIGSVLDISALVMVRAGELHGNHEMTFEMVGPNGKLVKHPDPFLINFTKADPAEAATLQIRFALAAVSAAGLYWINVYWNGEPLTKIPFRLVTESVLPGPEAGAE